MLAIAEGILHPRPNKEEGGRKRRPLDATPKRGVGLPVQLREEGGRRIKNLEEMRSPTRSRASAGPKASPAARSPSPIRLGKERGKRPAMDQQPRWVREGAHASANRNMGGTMGNGKQLLSMFKKNSPQPKFIPQAFLSTCGSKSSFILSAAGLGSNSTKLRRFAILITCFCSSLHPGDLIRHSYRAKKNVAIASERKSFSFLKNSIDDLYSDLPLPKSKG